MRGSRGQRVEDVSRSRGRSAQSDGGKECHGKVSEVHVVRCGDVDRFSEKSG